MVGPERSETLNPAATASRAAADASLATPPVTMPPVSIPTVATTPPEVTAAVAGTESKSKRTGGDARADGDGRVDVEATKQRLREVARQIDPLAPLRRNPFTTVGAAAVLGVVAASPAAARFKATQKTVKQAGIIGRVLRLGSGIVMAKVLKMVAEQAERVGREAEASADAPPPARDPVGPAVGVACGPGVVPPVPPPP